MFLADDEAIKREIDRLEDLVAALKSVLEHGMPTAESLPNAPIINEWWTYEWPKTVLCGQFVGYPTDDGSTGNGDGMTSELYLLDSEAGVARSTGRWYRLGPPMKRLVDIPELPDFK